MANDYADAGEFVRKLILGSVIIGAAIVPCLGQQGRENATAQLLARLHSAAEPERAKAFGQLRSDPANFKNPTVRAALLELLNRENHELDSQLEEAQKKGYPDEGDNEAWAEYYSDLLSVVDSFANWDDPRQACILVNAGSSDDSAFATEVAGHARVTIPCLVTRSKSAISMNRAVAVPVLVQALERGKGTLDAGTVRAARQIVLAALQDPDEGIRGFTVHALGKFGTEDMVAALRKVAETDPSPEVEGHSIRKAAVDAISAIEKRAGKQQH